MDWYDIGFLNISFYVFFLTLAQLLFDMSRLQFIMHALFKFWITGCLCIYIPNANKKRRPVDFSSIGGTID